MARDCPAAAALELHPRHLCGCLLEDEEDEEQEDEEGRGGESGGDSEEGGEGGGGGGAPTPLSVAQLEALEQLHLAALGRVARRRAACLVRLRAAEKAAREEHRRQVRALLLRTAAGSA